MCVDAERERRIRVAEDVGDPSDASPRLQRERRPGVPRAVELEGSNALLVRPAPQSKPSSLGVARIRSAANLRAEHPERNVAPALVGSVPPPRRQEIEQLLCKARRHRHAAGLAALRCRDALLRDRAAHGEDAGVEVDVGPLNAERLAPAQARREEEHEKRREAGLVYARESDEGLHLASRPVLGFLRLARASAAHAREGSPRSHGPGSSGSPLPAPGGPAPGERSRDGREAWPPSAAIVRLRPSFFGGRRPASFLRTYSRRCSSRIQGGTPGQPLDSVSRRAGRNRRSRSRVSSRGCAPWSR
jgi:hypothetical protein